MSGERYHVNTLKHFVGQELGISLWLTVDQRRISEFAFYSLSRTLLRLKAEPGGR